MDRQTITLDWRLVSLILFLALIGAVGFGHPWQSTSKKTISVTGENSVKAAPDQFGFAASYEKKASTSQDATAQVSQIGNDVVSHLKDLGVKDGDIANNVDAHPDYSSVYSVPSPAPSASPSAFVADYTVTVTITDKDLAQKVTNYLATTPVQNGTVSPSYSFSKVKQTELEQQARAAALADAKGKADQTAQVLGVKVGKVSSVSETNPFTGPIMYSKNAIAPMATDGAAASPVIQPGTNDYQFSVSVVYEIR